MMPDHLAALLARLPLLQSCRGEIEAASQAMVDCFRGGGKILVCGNGGSAADAGHIVGELMKGFLLPRPLSSDLRERLEIEAPEQSGGYPGRLQGALPALDLTAQTSLLTAIGNDLGGDLVFAQQVLGYGRPGDLLLAISTSGRARNVLNALRTANASSLVTVGLSGQSGGEMPACCKVLIRVPAERTAEIQEMHLPVYHALCAMVEEHFFAEKGLAGEGSSYSALN